MKPGFNPPKHPPGALRSAARRGLLPNELALQKRDEAVERTAEKRAADAQVAARRPRVQMGEFGASTVVDPELLEAYRDITRAVIDILEYAERGGAAAYAPGAFLLLTSRLKDVEVLRDVSRGTGDSILQLMGIIQAAEGDDVG